MSPSHSVEPPRNHYTERDCYSPVLMSDTYQQAEIKNNREGKKSHSQS